MYLVVGSADSKLIHPTNSPCEFIAELSRLTNLKGIWKCALVDYNIGKQQREDLYVYCDLIQESPVHGEKLPLLRIIRRSGDISNPYYIPVNKDYVYRLRFTIKTAKGKLPSSPPTNCRFGLHLKKE